MSSYYGNNEQEHAPVRDAIPDHLSTPMQEWKTNSTQIVLDYPPRLRVELHQISLPNGKIIDDWSWIVLPEVVNVIAITKHDHKFLLFKQTKYSCGNTLAVVGGWVEHGESPLQAAKRELIEETGYVEADAQDNWVHLGSHVVDANRGCGKVHLFMVTDVVPVVHRPTQPDLEEQILVFMDKQQVKQALMDGCFKCVTWTAALAMTLLRLEESRDCRRATGYTQNCLDSGKGRNGAADDDKSLADDPLIGFPKDEVDAHIKPKK